MSVNDRTTTLFIDVIDKWAQAVRARDLVEARFQIRQLRAAGQMLISNPELQLAGKGQPGGPQSLEGALALLDAIAEAHTATPANRQPRA